MLIIKDKAISLRPQASLVALPFTAPSTMLGALLRRNMSQKLSVLLLVFGLAWGLMLLRYTVQQPRHQSSAELREQILELSRRYVKVLTEENQNAPGGPQGTSMAGYGKCGVQHHNWGSPLSFLQVKCARKNSVHLTWTVSRLWKSIDFYFLWHLLSLLLSTHSGSEEDYSRAAGWHPDTLGQTGGENRIGGQCLLH